MDMMGIIAAIRFGFRAYRAGRPVAATVGRYLRERSELTRLIRAAAKRNDLVEVRLLKQEKIQHTREFAKDVIEGNFQTPENTPSGSAGPGKHPQSGQTGG